MASQMGNIIAVVAVLLIHIDKNQAGNMKPNINLKPEMFFYEYFNIVFNIHRKQGV